MAGSLEVSPEGLTRGAQLCSDAGDSASRSASRLSAAGLPTDMFGAFAGAHEFHSSLSQSHADHQERLHGHRSTLSELAGKADGAAARFTRTDETAARSLDRAAEQIGD